MAGVGERHTVYLSVGSNLGDKLDNCLKGIAALGAGGECELLAGSRFYRTSPVDYMDQDWFVNAAVQVATRLDPSALLEKLLAVQSQMGRKGTKIRFGPRTLDLDILLYDQRVMRTPTLEIPHPRMHKRVFVLQPICDINPAINHPVLGKTVADLLQQLDAKDQQVVPLRSQPKLPQGGSP
jgi:2-amino-4-hydroxy-6-hydroxymethyldihydropteridine diphosphokinase